MLGKMKSRADGIILYHYINGHLSTDKCILIRRSFTKIVTPHQRSWFTSPACIFPYIYLPLHITFLFSLRNCLRFVPHLLFNIKLKHAFSLRLLAKFTENK